jgi:hypothetical protein
MQYGVSDAETLLLLPVLPLIFLKTKIIGTLFLKTKK